MPNPLLDYEPESETLELTAPPAVARDPFELTGSEVLDEGDQIEFGSRLLELRTRSELDELLSELMLRAVGERGDRLRSQVGRALRATLGDLGARLLSALARPLAGGREREGAKQSVARSVSGLGSYFGLGLEGLSLEDQEFEAARAFIRLAASATRYAVTTPRGKTPVAVAQRALIRAARRFAPGLLRPAPALPAAVST